jgi:LemA protein
MSKITWIVAAIMAVPAAAFISIYYSLVIWRNRVRNAWSQIDVQLKRRYDLIASLVEIAEVYVAHEREVFERATGARSWATNASGPVEIARANEMLMRALKPLTALAEAYPGLKADQDFRDLQQELAGTEAKILPARQSYNGTVTAYNIAIAVFPRGAIARMFDFKAEQLYELPPPAKEPPKASFRRRG